MIEVKVEFEIKPSIVHVTIYHKPVVRDWILADAGWAAAGEHALTIALDYAHWAVNEIAQGKKLDSNLYKYQE